MDAIDRQAAIDAMHQYSHFDDFDQSVIDEETAVIAIKELPSVQPERWIPVSERLPDTDGDYLVTGRQRAVNKRRFEDGRWYGNWAVLAWMPLPEPYQEGADE